MLQMIRRVSLKHVTAAGIGFSCLIGLLFLHFTPAWAIALVALTAAALTFISIDMGVMLTLVALCLPLIAMSPITGITFIALTLVALRYLGSSNAKAYFIAAFALVAALLGPVWATAGIAGCLLGLGGATLSVAIACLAVEGLGLAMGASVFGGLVIGSRVTLLDFSKMPASLFSPGWVGRAFGDFDPNSVNEAFRAITGNHLAPALVLQPVMWVLGAATAWWYLSSLKRSGREDRAPLAAIAGTAVAALGSALAVPFVQHPPMMGLLWALASSLVVAPAVVVGWKRWITPLVVSATPIRTSTISLATEDADVDELLQLIASAEDKLSSHHTSNKTVLITDMKSFSRMTEEDGSLLSAQAVQRLRDLLLPVIFTEGGSGKSTGGDGLVAAFDSPAEAVRAAIRIQIALADYNQRNNGQRELMVRVGIATGEVVLDKNGRPFIGSALNLAARVMNLADGGQAFATSDVVGSAGAEFRSHSHGAFEFKNIGQPVEVFELLWLDGQKPSSPEDRLSA